MFHPPMLSRGSGMQPIVSPDSETDTHYMAEALALSQQGLGRTAPNPSVGAIIVKDGKIVGRGWTQPGGRPHAETEALAEAGDAARGATLYVTLEPCSHFGVTPPCASAIIAAGVARVVCALEDPDPRVSGRGYRMLREAGIAVTHGVLEAEARRANLGHIRRVQAQRPMVTLKLAMTADGFVASTAPREGQAPRLKITGAAANEHVHRMRAQHDAIMIGIGTALADDPMLTVRLSGQEEMGKAEMGKVAARPRRIVLDSHLRLPLQSHLVQTAADYPTLVLTRDDASAEAMARLREASVVVETLESAQSTPSLDLSAALQRLASLGLTRIFSEGGPRVAESLIGQHAADEVILLESPAILGAGVEGLSPRARAILGNLTLYRPAETRMIEEDRLTRYERID
ncbi:bifunctional diaminohydroxyphosphoribosylaminopyrimidine deaminase/5-amino-6-(5-phosphoribosylamino)uracil reductase RibD [Beijerinckia indica]|uniref:Riboflavin biosynthesis protein RibD n=1 Tax=Beijerinckia indica subsp. indica (strain ATCC 9039 / DSM 1715 / NCIMB 8712) TaxID=395963 RepID=B2IJJ4_BEII9|nr:bifunctional diaminohydroxyphosphoribosylaminopyrimidine deaminase/5-amino-6-(5-phosphoribosylamino)uracil reductase RibD [Beijerinckia indica]ACB94868.1 riboflavin biosynthesis protein RibD [Beijerinckia indica subsp. indica ATCC 9039]